MSEYFAYAAVVFLMSAFINDFAGNHAWADKLAFIAGCICVPASIFFSLLHLVRGTLRRWLTERQYKEDGDGKMV